MSVDPLLVVLVGPTASGKTALSLALAERFMGEIVNCDSVAVYREFEIGTAKPTADERARVPHHLFDILAPTEQMTAGEYSRRARQALADLKSRARLPIVVGGTGLYLRALIDGLAEGPERSDELRDRLRTSHQRHGEPWLNRVLQRLDPAAAARIHAHDIPKLIRAIEVCLVARRPLTDLWQEGREPLRGFRILRLGLDPERNALYTRINRRAEQMFAAGLIAETRTLLARHGREARPITATGYKQVLQMIDGEISPKLALWAAQQAHRNYAKRQMTWFRREPAVHWFKGFGDEPSIQEVAITLVEQSVH